MRLSSKARRGRKEEDTEAETLWMARRGGEGRERAEMSDMNELRHLRGSPGQHNGFYVVLREQRV